MNKYDYQNESGEMNVTQQLMAGFDDETETAPAENDTADIPAEGTKKMLPKPKRSRRQTAPAQIKFCPSKLQNRPKKRRQRTPFHISIQVIPPFPIPQGEKR